MIAIKKVTILHTNDTHSYLNNFHKRKHVIDSAHQKYDNVLVVDSGDNLRGSLYYTVFEGEKEPYLLNKLGYDYMTLGNHDFDNGSKDVYHFLSHIHSQIILSNVQWEKDAYLKQITNYKPWTVHTFEDGLKIGIIGLLTPTTQNSSSPSEETLFFDPIDVSREKVAQLQKENVDVIIALSHLGDVEDVRLAEEVSGIHYIIGSHTHKVLEQPIVVTNDKGWQTQIFQAGSYGNYIGELEIGCDDDGVKRLNYQLIDLREYPFYDEALYEELKEWDKSVEAVVTKPIATLQEDLNGKRDVTKYTSTNLTNLITDAYLDKAKALGFSPDLAIMNSGGIRQTLKEGVVTYGDVLQILPFACELYICHMTGKDLFSALDSGEYPQVSQAKVVYHAQDDELRLKEILIKTPNGYEPLQMDKTYLVSTNTFIGTGKDGYIGFENTHNLLKKQYYDTDVLVSYLKKLPQPITYTNEVRKRVIQ
ncbi:bifunctional metallophosphatase/5'-nucleotidase [Carnobacteriaceae bacterium zg-ZUI240]|nr:bifunctional metallophosphatase/5'-nucleotidase [Carnobacteriaceae bacterium zg-ZUI240]